MPFQKLCVGLKHNEVLNWAVIQYNASSLYDVIADGKYRSFGNAGIGRDKWHSLLKGNNIQPKCNREGFNLAIHHAWARIGLMGNNEDNCHSPDSVIGFGLKGGLSCGARQWHHRYLAAQFGYVMIQ